MHCYAPFRLACACAEKAVQQGYQYFELRFYGECWAAKDFAAVENILKDGASASNGCIGNSFSPCNKNDPSECVGRPGSTYVYLL